MKSNHHHDSACRANERAVNGLIGIAAMSVLGGLVLAAMGKQVPEWTGNLALTSVGILGGYLSNLLKNPPTHSTVTTDTVENVNVSPKEEEKKDNAG